MSFAISRNRDGGKNHGGTGWCKHIARVMQNTCHWQEGLDRLAQTIPGVCPNCGGSTGEAPALVLPESPTEAAEKVTESLLALVKELEKSDG